MRRLARKKGCFPIFFAQKTMVFWSEMCYNGVETKKWLCPAHGTVAETQSSEVFYEAQAKAVYGGQHAF
jgi:hypothetical protein